MSEKKITTQELIQELPSIVKAMDGVRSGTGPLSKLPKEISLEEMAQEKYNLSRSDYFKSLGVDSKRDTMSNLYSVNDTNLRWLVPEIIREAVILGMRDAPFYPNIIASDQPVNSLTVTMPYINMSDAAPARVNEGETIPLGTVSFGEKSVKIFKIGKGFKLTDEVRNYVSLDVMSIFVRDFGVQLGYAMDNLAMQIAINGNQADGSESAPVIGVNDPTKGYQYRDFLKTWIRGSRIGRGFRTMIGDEDTAIDILDLEEFKIRHSGTTQATLNLKSPVPNSADFFIHPSIPVDQLMLIDPRAAMIKLTAKQLMLESERIVSNQTSAIYASITTGFSKMYQDAVIMMDKTKNFSNNGFPEYMDPDPLKLVNLE